MNPTYTFEDIDDYLYNRMSASDRLVFEQTLQTDANLVQHLEALRAESKVLRLLRDDYLLEQFADWQSEDAEKKTEDSPLSSSRGVDFVSRYRRWLILTIVASLIGLVVAGIVFEWFISPSEKTKTIPVLPLEQKDTIRLESPPLPPNPDKQVALKPTNPSSNPFIYQNAKRYAGLAKETYRDEDFNDVLMGANDQDDTVNNYTKAVKLYSEKQYKETLKLLEQPEKDQREESLFLRGYTYYQLGQYAKAEQDFRASRKGENFSRKLDAIWCEVFSLVKQLPSSRKRLDTVLQEITTKPDHHYYKDAIKLQEDLEKK
jgi:tetratricopeptide (TPR) repeat protein